MTKINNKVDNIIYIDIKPHKKCSKGASPVTYPDNKKNK